MLTRLPTLLAGKAFAVYERLPEGKKDGYKKLVEALTTAFGGDDMGKHIAMMSSVVGWENQMRTSTFLLIIWKYYYVALCLKEAKKTGVHLVSSS